MVSKGPNMILHFLHFFFPLSQANERDLVEAISQAVHRHTHFHIILRTFHDATVIDKPLKHQMWGRPRSGGRQHSDSWKSTHSLLGDGARTLLSPDLWARKVSWRMLPSWQSLGTRHPRWRPSSSVSVPRLMLSAWWPGGPGITRLLDIFGCAIPPAASVLLLFSSKGSMQLSKRLLCVNTATGTVVARQASTPSICPPGALPVIEWPHEHPQWNLLSAVIILWLRLMQSQGRKWPFV